MSPTKIPPLILTVTYGTASCTTAVAPLTEGRNLGLSTEKGSGRTSFNIQTFLWDEALHDNQEERLSIAMGGTGCTESGLLNNHQVYLTKRGKVE